MGAIGRVLRILTTLKRNVSIAQTVTELTAGELNTSDQYGPAGDDSRPLPDDLAFVEPKDGGTGSRAALGYVDPVNPPEAVEGEKRLYSRDVDGVIAAVVWLKQDGTIAIESPVESMGPLVDDLIDAVKALITTGPPTVHTVSTASQAALDTIKARFNTLLGA